MSPVPQDEEDAEEQRPVRQTLLGALKYSANWKCFILSALIIGCLSAITWCRVTQVTEVVVNFRMFPITRNRHTSLCEDGVLYLPLAVLVMLYLLYLVECFHCPTRIQLKHTIPSSDIAFHIEAMRSSQPIVWWKAVCYHYVRRSRHVTRYRNGDAYTSTQVFYERVNSQAAGTCFLFANCGVKDISKKLIDLSKYPITKIRFSKGFAFANLEAANEFEEQRTRFFQENERRDDYMEMREGLDLTNVKFREFAITHRDTRPRPWYTRTAVFWAASVLLLSWPLRLLIEVNTSYVHYQVTKLFGVNYIASEGGGRISRESTTIDSRELEANIAYNCSLVPSYSEALLMESLIQNSNAQSGESTSLTNISAQTGRSNGDECSPNTIASGLLSPGTITRRLSTTSNPQANDGRQDLPSVRASSLRYSLYYATPLLQRTPPDPFEGRAQTTPAESPPCYEDALRESRPLLTALTGSSLKSIAPYALRRSFTERHIPSLSKIFLPRRSCNYDLETHL